MYSKFAIIQRKKSGSTQNSRLRSAIRHFVMWSTSSKTPDRENFVTICEFLCGNFVCENVRAWWEAATLWDIADYPFLLYSKPTWVNSPHPLGQLSSLCGSVGYVPVGALSPCLHMTCRKSIWSPFFNFLCLTGIQSSLGILISALITWSSSVSVDSLQCKLNQSASFISQGM